jgi:hypothetical protein
MFGYQPLGGDYLRVTAPSSLPLRTLHRLAQTACNWGFLFP